MNNDEQLGIAIAAGIADIHRTIPDTDLVQLENALSQLEASLISSALSSGLEHRIPLIELRILHANLLVVHAKCGPYSRGTELFNKSEARGFEKVNSKAAVYLDQADFCRKHGRKEVANQILRKLEMELMLLSNADTKKYLEVVQRELKDFSE